MSLINEALKKAQGERGDTPSASTSDPLPDHLGTNYTPKPRKRNHIWGFIIAVLVITLIGTIASVILLKQFMPTEEAPEITAAPAKTQPGTTPAAPAPEAIPPAAPTVAEVEPPTPVSTVEVPVIIQTIEAPAPRTAAETATPIAEPDPLDPFLQEETPKTTKPITSSSGANPAVWNRLQNLEIRGVMSGGEKVLIQDLRSGRTKRFGPGDMVDGTLGLRITTITLSEIVFTDYDGSQYTKSF